MLLSEHPDFWKIQRVRRMIEVHNALPDHDELWQDNHDWLTGLQYELADAMLDEIRDMEKQNP